MSEIFEKYIGRFAPSPSGRMHFGNIYAALFSWLCARKKNGRWLVRIEDLDRQRCKEQYSESILDDLRWLGLEWDGDVVFQSARDDAYKEAFSALQKKGLLYPCFCTRADLHSASAPHESAAVYKGTCRFLSDEQIEQKSKEKNPSWRIRVSGRSEFFDLNYGIQKIDLEKDAGDFVVRRADGNFSYQLAVCVDDAFEGVTQIVRGRDLISSAHQQIFLYRALSQKIPQFCHIPLILANDGRRLSKRNRDISMEFLRAHFSKEEIIGKIMHISGFLPQFEPLSLFDALSIFDFDKLPKRDITMEDF